MATIEEWRTGWSEMAGLLAHLKQAALAYSNPPTTETSKVLFQYQMQDLDFAAGVAAEHLKDAEIDNVTNALSEELSDIEEWRNSLENKISNTPELSRIRQGWKNYFGREIKLNSSLKLPTE